MKIEDLRTPAFLIDLKKLENNALRMRERARALGVNLRPHVKSHKTLEIARIQTGGVSGPITVSTLAEARFFVRNGFNDLTYAFPATPDKLEEIAGLQREGARLHILVDHPSLIESLETAARLYGTTYSVFLKVDCGYHRAGVSPARPESIDLARRLASNPAIWFAGILTHAGQSYKVDSAEQAGRVAEAERSVMADFAGRLSGAGVPVRTVSVGSTPTAAQAARLEGVTEIRPGNYVFYDKFQSDIGICSVSDCAASILTRVAGIYSDRREWLVDAGALALSKDPGATHVLEKVVYGRVAGHPSLEVTSLSQEHGLVQYTGSGEVPDLKIGSLLRIVPNHSCLAAALFASFAVIKDGWVVDRWTPVRGW